MVNATVQRQEGRLEQLLPILSWARGYQPSWLRADLVAGLTVAAVAVPEDMAYAALAGLPPQVGLCASLVSMLVYAVLGTCRQLSYGVTSALSIMVAGSLGAMALAGPEQYLAAASFVAIVAAAFGLIAWVLRLGVVANFVSRSVLVGFSAGAALVIASSQLPKAFGVEGTSGNFFERTWHLIGELGATHALTLGVALVSLVLLIGMESRFERLPAALFVVLGAIAVVRVFDLEARGLHVAGAVPSGLPQPSIPVPPVDHMLELVTLGFGVFLLSYVEGVGVAKTISSRLGQRIDANQELLSNSAANAGAGLFGGYAVGGSMSRSAMTEAAGARTQAAGAIAAVAIGVVLLFLTGLFSSLPEATLAAIILVAVRHLFNVQAMRRLWRIDRTEFLSAVAAFAGVLVFGMLEGILIGVVVTFLQLLRRVSRPIVVELGRLPGTHDYVSLERNPNAEVEPDIIVVRANSSWFFANAGAIRSQVAGMARALEIPPSLVIIDFGTSPWVDLGALTELEELGDDLEVVGADIALANIYASVGETLDKAGTRFAGMQRNVSIEEVVDGWHERSVLGTGSRGAR